MKTPTLAPVYLDNEPVSLMGDPRPQASKVIAASGRYPEKFALIPCDKLGDIHQGISMLDGNVIIDRTTDPTTPLYFTVVQK